VQSSIRSFVSFRRTYEERIIEAQAAEMCLLRRASRIQRSLAGNMPFNLAAFMRLVGIPLATIAVILMLGRIADASGVLLSGPLADFCKRRMAAYIAIALTTLLSYPFVLAVLSKRILLIIALQIPISFFGIGVLHGLAPILASESFPTKFRYSGTGISYNLCHIFGGMISPSVLAGFIGQDVFHKWYYVPACYAFYGVVAMLALVFIRETRDVSLELSLIKTSRICKMNHLQSGL